MKEHMTRRSKAAGMKESILPTFSQKQSESMKGTYDYIGVNMYTSYIAKAINYTSDSLFWQDSIEADFYQLQSWKKTASKWLRVSNI